MVSQKRHNYCEDTAERSYWNSSELFDTKNLEIYSATCHFKKYRKYIVLTSYIIKTKSQGKKYVVVLRTSRPIHAKTIDDGKEKSQTIMFYDIKKGGTSTVGQLNDYYIVQSNSLRWVMVSLSYMLDTARVNGQSA